MPSSEKLFSVGEQHLNHQNEFWVVNKIQNILARKYQILNIEKYGVFSAAFDLISPFILDWAPGTSNTCKYDNKRSLG